jgi:hypothetical protein
MKQIYVVSLDEEFQKARKLGAKDIKKRKRKLSKKKLDDLFYNELQKEKRRYLADRYGDYGEHGLGY